MSNRLILELGQPWPTTGPLHLLVRHSGITSLLLFARLFSLLAFPCLPLSLSLTFFVELKCTENASVWLHSFIHSFIHSGYLYSTPSRNLLRGALSPATVKEKFGEYRWADVQRRRGLYAVRSAIQIPLYKTVYNIG